MKAQKNKKTRLAASKVLIVSIITTLVQGACSNDRNGASSTIDLGDDVVNFASSMNSNVDNDRLWLANDATGKIYSLSISKFQIERQFAVPFCDSPSPRSRCLDGARVIGSSSGKYVIAVADDEYFIVREDGSIDRNPVRLQGKIGQRAYTELPAVPGSSQPDGILALSDDLGSLALLQISPDGQVLAHVLAGSVIPDSSEQIRSAIVIPGTDTLLVRSSAEKIYRVAMSQAIAKGELELVPVTIPAGVVFESALPLRGEKSRVLVREKDKISIVDVDSMAVIEQVALDSSLVFVGEYRGRWPHMAYVSQGPNRLVHFFMVGPSGKITSHKLLAISSKPSQSFVNEAGDKLTFVAAAYAGSMQQIYQVRLKDSLVTGRPRMEFGGKFALTEQYVFDIKPSIFGAMSRIEIERPENVLNMEWFNLDDALQAKF
ncbi:MAG: hypothetical protein RIQ81_2121 [Pseudomonadota bacterium]